MSQNVSFYRLMDFGMQREVALNLLLRRLALIVTRP